MRFSFFSPPSTLKKLYGPDSTKVLLAGGFNGYWNFGDMLMLQSVVRWHHSRPENAVVVPLHELSRVPDVNYLEQLPRVLGTEDFVVYTSEPGPESLGKALALGLEPVVPQQLRGAARMHVYGGGYFNRFWGQHMLGLVEATLRTWLPGHYVLSGLQVGPEFADAFAAHAQQWHPVLIGCRDAESVAALKSRGLDARLSGDDALEEMERAVAEDASRGPRVAVPGHFALHMNISGYVYARAKEEPATEAEPLARMNEQLQTLRAHWGDAAVPIVLNAYIDERPAVEDSVAAMRRTAFPELFPRAGVIDLVGLMLQGRLSQAVEQIRRCELLVASSYHVTLLGKVAGVPTHLFAFNAYYRQKKAGLEEPEHSLQEFLDEDRERARTRGDHYVASQRALRRDWLELLEDCLRGPVPTVSWVARATRWLEDTREELREAQRLREEEARATEDLRQRHQTLASLCEAQDARLRELESRLEEWEAGRAELAALREHCAHLTARVRHYEAQEAERQVARMTLIATDEPPLRHRLVDDLNERLMRAGGPRAHGALKQLMRAAVGRRRG
ncbi:polysaccharide pyruvyl transferase family protein [Myxococcus stipitatus]|uniref:polysaccharide pyruvyl transferase family protein n=1 Tax=Myxococcus stipitatus TaxID=83455 RepID=UPI001F31639F|nr:polysaccharide pyruvyl transferase family protein [Myxococcus stipitatus]MCE9667135.1 polysaccharide pyruvyl transferase family protein [Myxococcus stipitatus]